MTDRVTRNAPAANQGTYAIPTPSGTNVLSNFGTEPVRPRPGFVDVGYVLDAFQTSLSIHDRLLLITLATWTDKAGMCFPSLPTIAARSGLDERTIRAGLARLERAGRVSVTRRNRKVSLIRVHRLASDVDVPSSRSASDADAPRASDNDAPVYSHTRTQPSDAHEGVTKEANNKEEEEALEPNHFCDRHMPFGPSGPCGPCGSARVGHSQWEKLYRPAMPTPMAPRVDLTPMCAKHDGYPDTHLLPCEACKREAQAVSA